MDGEHIKWGTRPWAQIFTAAEYNGENSALGAKSLRLSHWGAGQVPELEHFFVPTQIHVELGP